MKKKDPPKFFTLTDQLKISFQKYQQLNDDLKNEITQLKKDKEQLELINNKMIKNIQTITETNKELQKENILLKQDNQKLSQELKELKRQTTQKINVFAKTTALFAICFLFHSYYSQY